MFIKVFPRSIEVQDISQRL